MKTLNHALAVLVAAVGFAAHAHADPLQLSCRVETQGAHDFVTVLEGKAPLAPNAQGILVGDFRQKVTYNGHTIDADGAVRASDFQLILTVDGKMHIATTWSKDKTGADFQGYKLLLDSQIDPTAADARPFEMFCEIE